MLLDRLEKIEGRLQPVFRVVTALLVGAWLTIILLYRKPPALWGGILVLWSALIAITASKPITTRRFLQMLRGASRTRGSVWRLTGFIVVVVGTSVILRIKATTFLEEVFAITIMTYVWFGNVLQVPEDS